MIDLTPLEVRKKKGDFRRTMRGYEPQAVDDFLDIVADRLEQIVREHFALTEKVSAIESQIADYRDRERALTEALVSAQEMREEMRRQMEREADFKRREAEAEAELVRSTAAQQRDREEENIRRLRARQSQFVQSYRSFLERELAELAVLAETIDAAKLLDDPDDAALRPAPAARPAPPPAPAPEAAPPAFEAAPRAPEARPAFEAAPRAPEARSPAPEAAPRAPEAPLSAPVAAVSESAPPPPAVAPIPMPLPIALPEPELTMPANTIEPAATDFEWPDADVPETDFAFAPEGGEAEAAPLAGSLDEIDLIDEPDDQADDDNESDGWVSTLLEGKGD